MATVVHPRSTAAAPAAANVQTTTVDFAAEASGSVTDGAHTWSGVSVTTANAAQSSAWSFDGSTGMTITTSGGDDNRSTETAPYADIDLDSIVASTWRPGPDLWMTVTIVSGGPSAAGHELKLLARDGTNWRQGVRITHDGANQLVDTVTEQAAADYSSADTTITPTWLGIRVTSQGVTGYAGTGSAPAAPTAASFVGPARLYNHTLNAFGVGGGVTLRLVASEGGAASAMTVKLGEWKVTEVVPGAVLDGGSYVGSHGKTLDLGADVHDIATGGDGVYSVDGLDLNFVGTGITALDTVSGAGLVVDPDGSTNTYFKIASTDLAAWMGLGSIDLRYDSLRVALRLASAPSMTGGTHHIKVDIRWNAAATRVPVAAGWGHSGSAQRVVSVDDITRHAYHGSGPAAGDWVDIWSRGAAATLVDWSNGATLADVRSTDWDQAIGHSDWDPTSGGVQYDIASTASPLYAGTTFDVLLQFRAAVGTAWTFSEMRFEVFRAGATS